MLMNKIRLQKQHLGYLRRVLSLVVWEIESAIAAAVGQMGGVRVLDVVGDVVQAEEHFTFRQSYSFPLWLLLVECTGFDRGAPRKPLWVRLDPSIPNLTSIPVAARTFQPWPFLPSIITWSCYLLRSLRTSLSILLLLNAYKAPQGMFKSGLVL